MFVIASVLGPLNQSCTLPAGTFTGENLPEPSTPDERLVPTTCTVATPSTSSVLTVLEAVEISYASSPPCRRIDPASQSIDAAGER